MVDGSSDAMLRREGWVSRVDLKRFIQPKGVAPSLWPQVLSWDKHAIEVANKTALPADRANQGSASASRSFLGIKVQPSLLRVR